MNHQQETRDQWRMPGDRGSLGQRTADVVVDVGRCSCCELIGKKGVRYRGVWTPGVGELSENLRPGLGGSVRRQGPGLLNITDEGGVTDHERVSSYGC
jgi:hypothetical protein